MVFKLELGQPALRRNLSQAQARRHEPVMQVTHSDNSLDCCQRRITLVMLDDPGPENRTPQAERQAQLSATDGSVGSDCL